MKGIQMPAELAQFHSISPTAFPAAAYPPRKRWTRDECRSLESTGLWERERLELIEGDLITRMSKNRPHMIAFILMAQWLNSVFDVLFINPEGPIDVSPQDNPTSEPEPDFAVLTKTATAYTTGNPPPQDVRLLIEISDSTLAFDLGPKANLYARAEIADYWVVDVVGRRIIVHRDPMAGTYKSVTAYADSEALRPLTSPEAVLQVTAVLPPR